MLATLNIVTNPFHPTLDRVQKPIQRKVKINTLVNRHKINLDKPVVCYHNGEAVLRKQWSKIVVQDKDVISFVYLPQGGGGSNPLRLILMIGMMAFAPYLASIIGPSLGLAAGSFGMSLLSAGIGFLGNQLINALIPPPQPPKSQQQSAMASPSPTYSIGAQGNQARIGQAIPVLYGTMKMYPDFAAQPYAEFENNEQYLYQLFCVTQGSATFNASGVFIEDSPIGSFGSDYQIEVVEPNTSSTLFPIDVYNVSEVAGVELISGVVGPFVVNPALTQVKTLAFDIVLPRGLNYINNDGGFDSRTVNFRFLATKIDDAGNNIGGQFTLADETITGATSTPIRKTYKYNVTPGRYNISVTRLSVKSVDSRTSNDIVWASSRGYSSATRNYGDLTLLAVKLKATNSISSQSSRKINIIATRNLEIPSLNATLDGFDWSARVSTQSIAWAIANMCRAAYGAGVTEARFDVGQLIALNAVWESRGDKLNCVFDSTQTFWDALCMACRAGRCRPYVQGGMIHFVRDAAQTLPTAMFTSRNIVKGSFKITYIMPSADNADCVDVEYFDEVIWKPRVVRSELDVGVKTKPAKVKAFGITNRAQAYKEGMYIAGNNRYRRKEISFETELEGHIPALGDLIGIQSDIPEWGQHGEVMSVTAVTGTTSKIVSSEPFVWTPAVTHYAMLRRADGSANGPIVVTQGATAYELIYTNADVDFSIYSGFDKEKTHISFGRTGQVIQLARVLSTTPQGNTVRVSAINEDARVHTADGTAIPLDLYEWSLATPKIKPILTDFTISQTGSGTTPSISLSWAPTAGASKYIIETSSDNLNWATLTEITGSSYSFISNVGMLYVRIAAFGGVVGPYITKSIAVGSVPPPADVVSGSISSNGQSYNVNWSSVADCDGYYVEVLSSGVVKRFFNTTTTNFDYTLENGIADGGPWRTITVKIQAKKGTVKSVAPLSLIGTNAAPIAPTVSLVAGVKNISITVSPTDEIDYAGTLIYAGDVSGFTPSALNLIYEGTANFFIHPTTTQKYYKAAHYDTYGKTGLNYSVVATATPNVGFGVFLEYSINGSTLWHSTYATGDMYMRQKVDDGAWSDAIPIVPQNSIIGTLTNESAVVSTLNDGAGGVFTGAGGTFNVYDGITSKTGNVAVTYSVLSSSGVTISIASTGVYTVTAMSTDTATATLRAVYAGVTIDKVYSIAKSKAGVIGVNGVDSTSYWMISSADAIQKNISGIFNPTTITFSGMSQVGASAPAAYLARFKIYENGSGTASYTSVADESSKVYTPSSSSVTSIKCEMYLAGGTTVKLDEQMTPVVVDGATGATGTDGLAGATGDNINVSKVFDFAGSVLPLGLAYAGTIASIDEGTSSQLTNTVLDQQVVASSLSLNPLDSYLITMRVKLVSGAWEGTIYTMNAGHGWSELYKKTIPAPTVGVWTVITLDMRTLSVGGNDFMAGGNVTGLRFDFANAIGSSIAVDYISLGKYGVSTGSNGDSVRIAYTKTTLSALSATPTTISTSGNVTFPANDSWGVGTVWDSVPQTLVAGESLYQSDGIYSAGANTTIWGKPYLSSLKVGSLSAITANMGSITSGTITLDTAGHIKGGQTAYNTGTGFFLGYSDTTYKFSIGNTTAGLTWDGAAMTIKGNLTAGSITLGTGFSASSTGAITIKSATTGARLEIYNSVIKVFDANGVLRVRLGDLLA